MSAPHVIEVAPAALAALQTFLRTSGSPYSAQDAIACAIRQWIERERTIALPLRGYQWKQLFLPDGTQLRMVYAGIAHYARVSDDDLVYRGQACTPRQLTLAIAGRGRNAWRDLWLLLPGEAHWINAARLRAQQAQQLAAQPTSPAAALTAASRAMSQSLQAAMQLIEHVDHQSTTVLERRLPRQRRRHDLLDDDY
jgi:hypothetical protein